MLKMNLMLIVDFFSLIEKHRLKRYKSVKIYSWTPRVIKEKVSHRRLPFPDCFRLHMLQLCRDSSGHLSLCVCLCARVCVCVCVRARERDCTTGLSCIVGLHMCFSYMRVCVETWMCSICTSDGKVHCDMFTHLCEDSKSSFGTK